MSTTAAAREPSLPGRLSEANWYPLSVECFPGVAEREGQHLRADLMPPRVGQKEARGKQQRHDAPKAKALSEPSPL